MRRQSLEPSIVELPDLHHHEDIPAISARILLGGKVDGYEGFMPGFFEEVLAQALLEVAYHARKTPAVARLAGLAKSV